MCGFVGVLKGDGNNAWSPEILAELSPVLRHRGPDMSGTAWLGPCGLAHHRLNVIDLTEAGRQPMTNESGRIMLACNGEIYNFQELREEFALDRNHVFRSRTDTEVIIHLYEELGVECLKRLNGMFALALWDSDRDCLYLARDPYGIKPLFYTRSAGAFWFASEIKALLGVPGFVPRPDPEALYHYLSFNYIPGELTAFAGIHEPSPGHMLAVRPGDLTRPATCRFFHLDYRINTRLTQEEAVEQSLFYLKKAVQRQLVADVPVGVMLSGGMDSSALAALMTEIRGDAGFHTFALKFTEASFDESAYARLVAASLGARHHEILVTPEKVRDLLPGYLAYIDEPYADGSAIPTFLLAAAARDHVTVLLSGEGGDEIFAGYDTYLAYKIRELYRRIPPLFRQRFVRKLAYLLRVSHKKLSLDYKAKRFVDGAELPVPEAHLYWRVVLTEEQKQAVLNKDTLPEGLPPSARFFTEAYHRCPAGDELNRLLDIDFHYHLPGDLMIKNDRMTMAHSLEARVPFTDNELVKYLSSVPVSYKLPGTAKKYLLRSAMKKYLPRKIITKPKVGLEMPYSSWFRRELRGLGEELFSRRKLSATGLFNPAAVARFWREHQEMKVNHGRFFWGLLNYLLWYDLYIGAKNFRSYLAPPRPPRTPVSNGAR